MVTIREPSSLSINLKQGIVTVLHFDCERSSRSASSIRRTLSSDNMSSKNWLHQNGFFTAAEKISSSDQECEKIINPLRDDIWSSILTQKSELINSSDIIPPRPYVHPLVKRSASNLSEKSLEFCTENLGSENGSDGFSDSEILSGDEEDRERAVGDLNVARCRKSAGAVEVTARPFPPPLASVGGGGGAPLLHMHSRRENGRLVLEAVSVPPKKYFRAQRGDGRLVLTLTSINPTSEEVDEEEEVVEDGGGDGGSQAEEVAEVKYPMEKNLRSLMKVDKYYFGLVMKKLIAMENNVNLSWDNKFKKEKAIVVAPPPEMVVSPAAAASLNTYEYFWRSKTIVSGGCIHPMITIP